MRRNTSQERVSVDRSCTRIPGCLNDEESIAWGRDPWSQNKNSSSPYFLLCSAAHSHRRCSGKSSTLPMIGKPLGPGGKGNREATTLFWANLCNIITVTATETIEAATAILSVWFWSMSGRFKAGFNSGGLMKLRHEGDTYILNILPWDHVRTTAWELLRVETAVVWLSGSQ